MSLTTQIALMAGLYLLLGSLEFLFPAKRKQPIKGRIINIGYTAIFLFVGGYLVQLLFTFVQFPTISRSGYQFWYGAFLVILAVIINDFIFYWYHRAEHSIPILWKVHKLHHTETNLNVTTSLRTNLLEAPIQALIISFPIAYITQMNGKTLFIFAATVITWEFFTHANIRLHLGKLTPVICGPQLHRIHHSIQKEHQDKNFAQYLPIFDVLFGTYCAPKKDEFPETGLTTSK